MFFFLSWTTINISLLKLSLLLMNKPIRKKHLLKFNNLVDDLLHFLYPNECLICEQEIVSGPIPVCPFCESELHFTYYEEFTPPTELDQLFWGRVPLTGTYALLHFKDSGNTQQLLHALKYGNRPQVGHYFGEILGTRLNSLDVFRDADALIPVPLHPKKRFQRGYNQAEELARGIFKSTAIPIRNDLLKRIAYTESQTKRDRLSRWENMQNRFKATSSGHTQPKHVVLIDDVVTTGSTLETIGRVLLQTYPDLKVSIACMARTV